MIRYLFRALKLLLLFLPTAWVTLSAPIKDPCAPGTGFYIPRDSPMAEYRGYTYEIGYLQKKYKLKVSERLYIEYCGNKVIGYHYVENNTSIPPFHTKLKPFPIKLQQGSYGYFDVKMISFDTQKCKGIIEVSPPLVCFWGSAVGNRYKVQFGKTKEYDSYSKSSYWVHHLDVRPLKLKSFPLIRNTWNHHAYMILPNGGVRFSEYVE